MNRARGDNTRVLAFDVFGIRVTCGLAAPNLNFGLFSVLRLAWCLFGPPKQCMPVLPVYLQGPGP